MVRSTQPNLNTASPYHIDGKDNPADILTKNRSSKEWFALLKPLIFWCSDKKNPDGATDGSHLVEGSVVQSPTAAPSSEVKSYKRIRFYDLFPRMRKLTRSTAQFAESTSASKFGNAPSAWDKPLPVTSFFINK